MNRPTSVSLGHAPSVDMPCKSAVPSPRWRPRDIAILGLLAAIGCAVAVVIVLLVERGENGDARNAFASTFGNEIEGFRGFFRTRLLCLRTVADALSLFADSWTPASLDKVCKRRVFPLFWCFLRRRWPHFPAVGAFLRPNHLARVRTGRTTRSGK